LLYAPDGRKPDTQEMTPLAKAALVLYIQSRGMDDRAIQDDDRGSLFSARSHFFEP